MSYDLSCATCGHGIHSHVDYVSTTDPSYVLDLVTTVGVQSEGPHLGTDNAPYIPSTSTSGTLPPPGDATSITFSQTHMPSPSASQSMNTTQITQGPDTHEFIFRHYIPRG
ncbi:hypothetical protein IW261DRAFT_1417133 [Armillaria novae-zelandiae]|uniref:Uncharacterized protein n=1 Tax=Armillaria novae-zelandiae TaxID=153914 RepID=A0AA39PG01_9AGAR|nr:hypothetical protein IW261DRAFT_1417133 [Armillaria novae-zelandiae]